MFFARLWEIEYHIYQPIIIKITYIFIKINKKNKLTEIRIYGIPVKNIIYRRTGRKQKKIGSHKFTRLHITANRLLISGMVFEKHD